MRTAILLLGLASCGPAPTPDGLWRGNLTKVSICYGDAEEPVPSFSDDGTGAALWDVDGRTVTARGGTCELEIGDVGRLTPKGCGTGFVLGGGISDQHDGGLDVSVRTRSAHGCTALERGTLYR